MKNSYKIIGIEIGLIIASLFSLFAFTINRYIYIAILVALSVGIYYLLKPERRKERFDLDILLIITITILFYYAITYFLGFFSGFYRTTYSRRITTMIMNVIAFCLITFPIETIREVLIKNNAYHKSIVWLTPIICFLLEMPNLVSIKLINTRVDLLSAILVTLLPALIKNFTLTYITYKSDKRNSIIYQALLTVPTYFVPVFPNLGEFISIVVNITLPILILVLIMNISTIKFERVVNSRGLKNKKIYIRVLNVLMVTLVLVMIYLNSNLFRFTSLAIGSMSMQGSIDKGDIVIIDKHDKTPKENDVIAFHEQGKIVVHRMVNIKDLGTVNYYITKGDANNDIDAWYVAKESIVGTVKLRIRWLGWPTVALSELLQQGSSNTESD